MKVEWRNKPITTFKNIKIGECFSLQYAEDDICIYLKIPIAKVVTTKGALGDEANAVNVESGNLVKMADNEEVQSLKATLMIET